MIAYSAGDFDRAFGELSAAEMRIENRSRSAFPDRSAGELRVSSEDLHAMVSSVRQWFSAMCWLTPAWIVARLEREAVGAEGEQYAWARLMAGEIRDGRILSMYEFEVDDEEAAFALAEELSRATPSRLALTNRATRAHDELFTVMRAHNPQAVIDIYVDGFTYDDRRRLSGNPIGDNVTLLAIAQQIGSQFSQFERRTLAVRGDRLQLCSSRWADDAGNETTHLHVIEVRDDGRICYEGRFDSDDFEGAYRELERRYCVGEGAAFAEAGAALGDLIDTLNHRDFDRLFGALVEPDYRVEDRSRSTFPVRSATDLRASFLALTTMVDSVQTWFSAVYWLSNRWSVARIDRDAVGPEGERYAWTWLAVNEMRSGRLASMCLFDPEEEEAAFALAEERMNASRLAVSNRATEAMDDLYAALRARNAHAAAAVYQDGFSYDDRRRLSGDSIDDPAVLLATAERILLQYNQFHVHVMAVRGERLQLARTRWSDAAGNETAQLSVVEVGSGGRIAYEGRFDGDDFDGAYRELERRYYAREGAEYAASGETIADAIVAVNNRDYDRFFGELSEPDLRAENRTLAAFPDRSASEIRASFVDLNDMTTTTRTWLSVMRWVSPTWVVGRMEREGAGPEGQEYAWAKLMIVGIRNGRMALLSEFELDDEAAAFDYAEQQMTASRLAVSNRATDVVDAIFHALRARNAAAVVESYPERFTYDDRRRISGEPIGDRAAMLAAVEQILLQYHNFERKTLAVRGTGLQLIWSRWSDDDGNETTWLHVLEVDGSGHVSYEGRFDADDFDGAYRELERRYYAAEGAQYAASGGSLAEGILALNAGDFDRLVGEVSVPELHVENRTRTAFPDRTAGALHASLGDLHGMMSSTRTWLSAMCWVSPVCSVVRMEREAVGVGGEQYAWTRILVVGLRDGRLASICEFELDDEDTAFGYAERLAFGD